MFSGIKVNDHVKCSTWYDILREATAAALLQHAYKVLQTWHAGSDAGTARPSSDGQAAHPGVPKKKHKAGKKAGKAAATASGGLPEEPAVEFLVATEAYQEQDGTLMKGELVTRFA